MKIRLIFNDDKNLGKVEARFYAVAAAYGMSPEDAKREAMLFWLRMVPDSSDFTLEVTDAEWKELRPVIAQIRERHASADPQSSREEPAS